MDMKKNKTKTQSTQPKLLPVLLTGHAHRAVWHLRSEHGLLVSPSRERQRDLAAFGGGALQREHDLRARAGVVEVAGMHFRVVVQPIGHFLDVRRHVKVVVHRAFAALRAATLRYGAPTAMGED